jgi:tripartite-type tricarboxylate transporter receptor subunit TctC
MRRLLSILVLLAAACVLRSPTAAADEWPTRPVTLIVPFAAGGNVDVVARLIGSELGKRLGQAVVVENVAGAAGMVGTERAARAEPDGYTLLVSVESTILLANLVAPNTVRYDGLRDFAPVALIATSPLALVGRPTLPAKTTAEVLELARQQPGKLTYGTSGTGTSLHLAGEMMSQKAGVKLVHLPYRAGAQVPTDLSGGHIDLAVLSLTSVVELVKDGRIKIFGVTEPQRWPLLPDVPTLTETPALAGVSVTVWQGLFAPARTPAPIVERLQREMTAILAQDALRDRLASLATRPSNLVGAEFAAFLKAEQEKYAEVVKIGNIRAE